ncbi:cytochrome C biogenesis protein [Oribacterium sp. C9]|uniref:redoxin domain-containing protein n=1 Tax=Oribacterium sp. C9 TaxID=1943579 RepID=UPI0009CF6C33|nr:cytochrome c biogenesis protein CcdA [Oribacterium sp. C9]OON87195.1 cytochrome C biogenesis protein [Oribacterium sp. C9]
MNIPVNTGISLVTVFLEGVISFFSPCVLPLIPVYIAYLSGGTLKKEDDGRFTYDRKKVMINTFFFTVGISFAFLILGFGMNAIGRMFSGHSLLFARIGGVIIILLGLYQLGFFGTNMFMSRELKLPFNTDSLTMSPFTAFLFGFLLSFAWTPCIGPVLSSILIMTASADTMLTGILLIFVYTLGYVIPFLLVGIFTTTLLEFFSRHRSIVRHSVKIGGALLIMIGCLMITGQMNSLSSYMSSISMDTVSVDSKQDTDENNVKDRISKSEESDKESEASSNTNASEESNASSEGTGKDSVKKNEGAGNESVDQSIEESTEETESSDNTSNEDVYPAYDFTLEDQYGNIHSLSDYKGKIVFLNFWGTWCPPCKYELPYIQELYEEYSGKADSDIVFLTITFPNLGQEKSVSGIRKFIDNQGYTFPVLMDTGYDTEMEYYINSFPTTFLIDPDGNILGYVPGAMDKEMMEDVIDRARMESGLS